MKILRTQEGSETWDSEGNVIECEIKYYVISPEGGKTACIQAVWAASPEKFSNVEEVTPSTDSETESDEEEENNECIRTGIRFDGYDDDGNMEITVLYSLSENEGLPASENDSPVVSFDCSGGSKHITHAISQKKAYPSSGTDDTGGAIGWNGKTGPEMEITGCDIPTGQLRESYTKIFRIGSITTEKKRKWASMVGKVNSSTFKGWQPGEVMFLGCTYNGKAKSSTKVPVQFNFGIQQNESNAKVDGHQCGAKKGFEVIWAMSETEKGTNDIPVAKVKSVYIAEVCEQGNFGELGL